MGKRVKHILKDTHGESFPFTVVMVLLLFLLLCGISEYFRLQVIVSGVREALEDGIISIVNDNYVGVYHGVREGYSGGYIPDRLSDWEESLNTGDLYAYLDKTIGTKFQGGRCVKYVVDENNAIEFAIDDLNVTIRNAPLAPSDPHNVQRFEAEAMVRLEVPVRFGGKLLPSMFIRLKVQAGYVEMF